MKIKFNVSSKIKKQETIEKVKLVLFDCMVKMHELAVINCPVDTSLLVNSIKIFPSVPGAKSYILADGVTYGIDVEFGTDPHVVKAAELKGWVKRQLGVSGKGVGLVAKRVAEKIEKKGTEAQPFFRPALDQVKNVWIKRYWERDLGK